MNVFRSRKKSMGDADVSRKPSLEEAPPLPKHSRTIFRRKKQAPEIKKEIDFSIALPSDNEFRTSLLLPNLSQRFSMLREQDDPSTKIGKASDDSVLFPKRNSRLGLLDGSLDDIAEVRSITGSFRPPFAQEGRVTSYASDSYAGYESDTGSTSGSIMTRAKPGVGNKLFGGRQKVYKISAQSRPGSAGNGAVKGLGKPVYEEDVSTSLWRKMKAEERAKASLEFGGESLADGRMSPTFSGYNRNRETASSTNSNERSSTAATSMTSMADASTHGLPTMMTKEPARDRPLNKRLYGQGIDQQVHEQQSSAMNRLNSVRGGRGFGPLGSQRAPNGAPRPGAISAASSLRSASPSPLVTPSGAFEFGLSRPSPINTHDLDSGLYVSPGMTPPISPSADPTFTAHLNPNDVGKATAAGVFNKPKARYDEQQFAQRQLQLQEGRETPVPGSQSRSETPVDRAPSRLRQGSDAMAGTVRQPSAQNYFHTARDRSISKHRDVTEERDPRHITGQAINGLYLAEISDSDDSPEPSSPQRQRADSSHINSADSRQQVRTQASNPALIYPHDDQHPALRATIAEEEEPENASTSDAHSPVDGNLTPQLSGPDDSQIDSPTLGPMQTMGGLPGGLSDMVRGHLRNHSDASSVYPDESPVAPQFGTPQAFQHHEAEPIPEDEAVDVAADSLAARAKQMLASAQRMRETSTAQTPSSQGSPPQLPTQLRQQSSIDGMSQRNHVRGPSLETQQERNAFADELADRRRQVEEKLKSIAETHARTDNTSGRSCDDSPVKGFGLMNKSSRSSLKGGDNNPSNVFKKLMPGSGSTTPTREDTFGERSPLHRGLPGLGRKSSEPSLHDRASVNARPGEKPSMRHRDIGAERRARHAAGLKSPTGLGPQQIRGRVDARKQQFDAGGDVSQRDFTQRINVNPDQGKPQFHPAGRARHYSPPRAKETPDQKAILAPHFTQATQPTRSGIPKPISKTQISRPSAPHEPSHSSGPLQPGTDRINIMAPPNPNVNGNNRHAANEKRPPSPVTKPLMSPSSVPVQMITPGTFPPPAGGTMQYFSARKRSVTKADISTPIFMSGTYAVPTVDLPPGASLDNGMDEVRAADAAAVPSNPPPVPPINPRRRAMAGLKGLSRANTGGPDTDGDGSGSASPRPGLRKQMSDGMGLRGRQAGGTEIPVRGYQT